MRTSPVSIRCWTICVIDRVRAQALQRRRISQQGGFILWTTEEFQVFLEKHQIKTDRVGEPRFVSLIPQVWVVDTDVAVHASQFIDAMTDAVAAFDDDPGRQNAARMVLRRLDGLAVDENGSLTPPVSLTQ